MYTFLVVPLYSFYMLIYIFFLHIYKFNHTYVHFLICLSPSVSWDVEDCGNKITVRPIQAIFICIIFQAPSVTDCQQFTYKLWTIQTLHWSVHDQLSSLANTFHISYTFFILIAMCYLKSSTEGKGDISAERTFGVACAVNLTQGLGVTASDNSAHDLPVSE